MLIPRLSQILVRGVKQRWPGGCQTLPWRRLSGEARPVYSTALSYGEKVAVIDSQGSQTYSQLYKASLALSGRLGSASLLSPGARVAILTDNSGQYVRAQWAVWMSGCVCVPLCQSHPASSLSYYLQDSGASLVLVTPDLQHVVADLGVEVHVLGQDDQDVHDVETVPVSSASSSAAMILYTSGTTGSPKGVVLSHANITSQTACLVSAWSWSSRDSILHVLPLHHTHGIVNCLLCPLSVGATVHFLPKFCPSTTWRLLTEGSVNLFMAVPTIYSKLLSHHDTTEDTVRDCSRLRLMVSGSAALAVPVLERWREVTGQTLLERYGMTEIGMALSQPLLGHRVPGTVGRPLPGVEVRLVSWQSGGGWRILAQADSQSVSCENCEAGELLVRGPNVFTEYYNRPEATRKEFTEDGWFRTGDTAKVEDGVFRILGRTSVDIIKTGGYKVSALDVETVLLTHPDILELAVVGVEDQTWGQTVAAVVVVRSGAPDLSLAGLREWSADKMPKYWIPSDLRILAEMPRNAMGKINKKQLIKDIFAVN